MTKAASYRYQVGARGAIRLAGLNKMLNPTSLFLLQQAGLSAGTRVLDLGCGIGILTKELGKAVGPSGVVVGIDSSEEQLGIAKEYCADQPNISFRQLDVQHLSEVSEQFNIVYSRLLLMHLSDPTPVVQAIATVLRPGGRFVSEEIGRYLAAPTSPWGISHKHDGAHNQLRHLVQEIHRLNGTGREMGWRLPELLYKSGFVLQKMRAMQPVLRTSEEKGLLLNWLEEVTSFVLEKQLHSKAELQELQEDLEQLVADPKALTIMGEVVQTIAQLDRALL